MMSRRTSKKLSQIFMGLVLQGVRVTEAQKDLVSNQG